MFHQWLTTDTERVDRCVQCGTAAPDTADPDSVFMDHGPLPIYCPGNEIQGPHEFTVAAEPDTIECVWCEYRITDTTLPDSVLWECRAPEGSDRDEWLEYHYPNRQIVTPF